MFMIALKMNPVGGVRFSIGSTGFVDLEMINELTSVTFFYTSLTCPLFDI